MGLLRNDEEKFYQSQLVEVKSCREILKTLDSEGKLEGMPFMPEMVSFCGKRIRVHRRADRTCVAGQGFHRMTGTVFLHESRCDGSHHDGCQRGCLLFWKEAWLKPARGAPRVMKDAPTDRNAARALKNLATRQGDRYMCQSTELASATVGALSRWDVRPWLREVFRGELTMTGFLAIVRRALFNRFIRPGQSHSLAGTEGKKSRGDLALREGEWVRVKRADELQGQLDQKNTNLGLAFQPTMHAAIGERFQVAYPIHRIIIEQTGKMVQLRNTVVLKGVTCQGPCAANCPRSEHLFWRESWLDRTGEKEVPAEEVVRYF